MCSIRLAVCESNWLFVVSPTKVTTYFHFLAKLKAGPVLVKLCFFLKTKSDKNKSQFESITA